MLGAKSFKNTNDFGLLELKTEHNPFEYCPRPVSKLCVFSGA